MKYLLLILALAPAQAATCPKNCVEWKGTCACDAPKSSAPEVDYASDEKPRRNQQPCWETGECRAVSAPNLAAQDAELDRSKAEADRQGKEAAGIR